MIVGQNKQKGNIMKFTTQDYKKMKRQPSIYRTGNGGLKSWNIASDICFQYDDANLAVLKINATLSDEEIRQVKKLLMV